MRWGARIHGDASAGYTSNFSRTLPPAAAEIVILVADSCLGLTLLAALGFSIWEPGGDKLTFHLIFKESTC